MLVNIKLSRSISGNELTSALERATTELGWMFSKNPVSHTYSYDFPYRAENGGFELKIKTRRFFGPSIVVSPNINPTHRYSEIGLYSPYDLNSPYGLSERQLQSFVSTLRKILG